MVWHKGSVEKDGAWSDVSKSPLDEDYSGMNADYYSFNSSADSKEKFKYFWGGTNVRMSGLLFHKQALLRMNSIYTVHVKPWEKVIK